MATNTYVALDTRTLTSATSSITFSPIPQGYTDLVLVAQPKNTTQAAVFTPSLFFNTDTGTSSTNYSNTWMYGTGSTVASFRWTSSTPAHGIPYGGGSTNFNNIGIVNIMNYSNSTTYKTAITRYQEDSALYSLVSLWRNTAPITSITLYAGDAGSNTLAIGSTFTLYGIANADNFVKATGGIISEDSTYTYHVFGSTGTFTPKQSLTADILVVAGGGGGNDGGGGAGGVAYYAAQSLTATAYTCTVGSGGAGSSSVDGASGVNSSFTGLTAAVGGGGGRAYNVGNGTSGGSGGGAPRTASGTATGGAATSGQGYAGGNSVSGSNVAGGGGGAGGAGVAGTGTYPSGVGGTGGAGTNAYASWLAATSLGVNGYIAGGGGGFSHPTQALGSNGGGNGSTNTLPATSGAQYTGSGGGAAAGGGSSTGNGGSGVIIVRYAK